MGSRWTEHPEVPRGDGYDARFRRLAESGADVHGEADLVESLLVANGPPRGDLPSVLDAGCGTGRVAIELARRGFDVTGVDLDAAMLVTARSKAPELSWLQADLSELHLDRLFDAVVLAGNVVIFVAPGTEAAVVARCAAHVRSGGLLINGFQIRAGGFGPDELDAAASATGLELVERWATWDRQPWVPEGPYQVSLHRRSHPGVGPPGNR